MNRFNKSSHDQGVHVLDTSEKKKKKDIEDNSFPSCIANSVLFDVESTYSVCIFLQFNPRWDESLYFNGIPRFPILK